MKKCTGGALRIDAADTCWRTALNGAQNGAARIDNSRIIVGVEMAAVGDEIERIRNRQSVQGDAMLLGHRHGQVHVPVDAVVQRVDGNRGTRRRSTCSVGRACAGSWCSLLFIDNHGSAGILITH